MSRTRQQPEVFIVGLVDEEGTRMERAVLCKLYENSKLNPNYARSKRPGMLDAL
jgi:hypothetical protein